MIKIKENIKSKAFPLVNVQHSRNCLISVIMGVYADDSKIHLLGRAVDSILKQTWKNIELVIEDSGSSVGIHSILDQIAQTDDRLILIREAKKVSLSFKLNQCIKYAKGNWIARMDDDDFSVAERLAYQLEYLIAHQEIAFVGCNVNLCRRGQRVGQWIFPEFPEVRDFYIKQPFVHPTILFHKEVLLAINGYSESNRCVLCEDYDLLLRLYAAGYCGANLQETLLDYTIPDTAKGNRKMRHRWNEAITRYYRFKELHIMPEAWPYVIKPVAVGMLPEWVLRRLKRDLFPADRRGDYDGKNICNRSGL